MRKEVGGHAGDHHGTAGELDGFHVLDWVENCVSQSFKLIFENDSLGRLLQELYLHAI